jgi:hypothetical protein
MASWHYCSLQGQLYLYVGEVGTRPSKNLEIFCSGEDFVMIIVITPSPQELIPSVMSRGWNLNLIFFFVHTVAKEEYLFSFSSDLTEQNLALCLRINIVYIKWFDVEDDRACKD